MEQMQQVIKEPIVASYTFRLMGLPYAGLIISRYQEENSSRTVCKQPSALHQTVLAEQISHFGSHFILLYSNQYCQF